MKLAFDLENKKVLFYIDDTTPATKENGCTVEIIQRPNESSDDIGIFASEADPSQFYEGDCKLFDYYIEARCTLRITEWNEAGEATDVLETDDEYIEIGTCMRANEEETPYWRTVIANLQQCGYRAYWGGVE